MITATPMLMCSPVATELYNITVTCTIHPDSNADQCEVMIIADDGMTRTGEIVCNDIGCNFHYFIYVINFFYAMYRMNI